MIFRNPWSFRFIFKKEEKSNGDYCNLSRSILSKGVAVFVILWYTIGFQIKQCHVKLESWYNCHLTLLLSCYSLTGLLLSNNTPMYVIFNYLVNEMKGTHEYMSLLKGQLLFNKTMHRDNSYMMDCVSHQVRYCNFKKNKWNDN